MINMGPGLGGMPAARGYHKAFTQTWMEDSLERWHEKVFVMLPKRDTQLVQMKESFLEETAVEQSSGRVFVNWEETTLERVVG